jgi:hypothetical protein
VVVSLLVCPALADSLGDHVIVVSNDLGMHCMNKDHHTLSVLPPYNTLNAQVILRGNEMTMPQIITAGLTLEYSIPGNTYSVGKTDFWDYAFDLFGVDLPPDIGLTGNGLAGEFEVSGDMFIAEGIPITPFTDANPTVEDPYQQAEVILRDAGGLELARSVPVMPVSTEMGCVSAGCHTSETAILQGHDVVGGFDPNATPILCADCHGSPPLTGPDPGSAGYFSLSIHEKHHFIDETIPGMDGCYKCHPGPQTQCLRGTMAHDFGMTCQDCHGNMAEVASSIDGGRIPWSDEPACRTCHTVAFGEPVGQLYRNARGHGGVLCSGCHNSPHATFPSRDARDNEVMVDLQGGAGTLSYCAACHGHVPNGPGPHGLVPSGVVEAEILQGPDRLVVFPSPAQTGAGCTIKARNKGRGTGKLLVFDARGRTIRMLRSDPEGGDLAQFIWDGRDSHGKPVASGVYFMRYDNGVQQTGGKVLMIN